MSSYQVYGSQSQLPNICTPTRHHSLKIIIKHSARTYAQTRRCNPCAPRVTSIARSCSIIRMFSSGNALIQTRWFCARVCVHSCSHFPYCYNMQCICTYVICLCYVLYWCPCPYVFADIIKQKSYCFGRTLEATSFYLTFHKISSFRFRFVPSSHFNKTWCPSHCLTTNSESWSS